MFSLLLFALASLVGAHVGTASSAVGLKLFTIISRIKRYETITKKKKEKHKKMLLLAKNKLNTIKVFAFKALNNLHLIMMIFFK